MKLKDLGNSISGNVVNNLDFVEVRYKTSSNAFSGVAILIWFIDSKSKKKFGVSDAFEKKSVNYTRPSGHIIFYLIFLRSDEGKVNGIIR